VGMSSHYTRCASAKGGLVRLQGAPPGCLCHTLTNSLVITDNSYSTMWSWPQRDIAEAAMATLRAK
jgi:hypothetical protein